MAWTFLTLTGMLVPRRVSGLMEDLLTKAIKTNHLQYQIGQTHHPSSSQGHCAWPWSKVPSPAGWRALEICCSIHLPLMIDQDFLMLFSLILSYVRASSSPSPPRKTLDNIVLFMSVDVGCDLVNLSRSEKHVIRYRCLGSLTYPDWLYPKHLDSALVLNLWTLFQLLLQVSGLCE